MTKRRRFTADFKAQVALEALRGDRPIQEIAARHKVHPNQVSAWKRQALDGLGSVFSNGAEKAVVDREAEIHDLAGEKFLVSSPKQLQVILFEKLKLPVMKKTKTGYSTAEDVLEQLAAHHELPSRVLAWRRLAKLKSTYLDALPQLVSPQSGRVHPTFNQTGAATGRLSATNPNVQNIPIRTEEGIRIREAFIRVPHDHIAQ